MSNPIISRDHFVACLNVLQAADDMAVRINEVVEEYGRGEYISGYTFNDSECEIKLLETLELAMNDVQHWISWWCIDGDYGRNENFVAEVVCGNKTYNLNSAEALYDFLLEHSDVPLI